MPSANKTSLGLNQWQANEYPKMVDFNEDNRIIDEKITELQSGSGVKIYTVAELTNPVEGKIYNIKIERAISVINGKSVYKENTTQSVTLKAGKVATVYYQGGSFFYKASASGNAVAENVLAGKKFSNENDTDIVGAMKDNGRKIIRPSTSNIIIPKGFHDGTGYVEGDSDLVASNIVQGKNIFGVSGQALQYQQNEKTAIANALTSKGVPTSTTASWGQIEQNIRKIKDVKTAELFKKIFGKKFTRVIVPKSSMVYEYKEYKFEGHYDVPRYRLIIPVQKNDILILMPNNWTRQNSNPGQYYIDIANVSNSDLFWRQTNENVYAFIDGFFIAQRNISQIFISADTKELTLSIHVIGFYELFNESNPFVYHILRASEYLA